MIELAAAGYRLNGTKVYSTGNLYADYIVVSAQDPAAQPVQLLVPADRDPACSSTTTGTASRSG